jgi:probable phosphoglycerate mutase
MITVTRMYLVRNGGALTEKPGQFVGQLDFPLSDAGEERIKKLLEVFKDERVDKIYASALKRAGQCAEIFSAFFGHDTVYHDGLKEINLGEFEGKTFEEISANTPDLAREMSANPIAFKYPGGESFLELGGRTSRTFWEIVTRSEGKNVVVFSHGGVNRTVLASLLGMPEEGIFKLEQDPAGVSLVEVVNRFPRIRFLNVTVR